MMPLKNQLRKYLILGTENCDRPIEFILKEALEAGITAFQFREKGRQVKTGQEKVILAQKLQKLCAHHNVPFIVNDDIVLAQEIDADGIHIGQADADPEKVRRIFPKKIIGLSISNLKEYENSQLQYIDYIGAGPIFTTRTKVDAKQAVGLEWVRTIRHLEPHLPIVAIGGINRQNAQAILTAGADGLAYISAVSQAASIQDVVKKL